MGEPPRKAKACAQCRTRKVKCDSASPCAKCQIAGTECVYPESRRGRRKQDPTRATILEERLARMEALMRSQGKQTPASGDFSDDHHLSFNTPPAVPHEAMSIKTLASHPDHFNATTDVRGSSMAAQSPTMSFVSGRVASSAQSFPTPVPSSALPIQDYPTGRYDGLDEQYVSNQDKESSVVAPQMVNWEHHGPSSWLSICSGPGLAWVSQRTGVTTFNDTAQELLTTWTRRLKLDRSQLSSSTHQDPDPETAWKYVKAYFEDSLEASLGIIYRPEFEAALRAHLRGEGNADDNPAMYAMRKTVYAAGCRIYLSQNSSLSFTTIEAEALRYFKSAMSVYTELLFVPTGLLAVRALAAMTFFAEGLANPALEYTLCANAARMAHEKGLHRRPAKAWNLAESDSIHHSWLFWAIYCAEKHISNRAGRPSAIDDDDISCEVPTEVCPGSTIEIALFTAMIQHARISSQISRRLMSVKAFQQSPSVLLQTAMELANRLREWRESLPLYLMPSDRLKSFKVPHSTKIYPPMITHYLYYGSLMAIHTLFAYPWITNNIFGNDRSVLTQDQIIVSSNTIADAARNIIVVARGLDINAASIQWPTFYYPMLGLINLFIYVLKCPTLTSSRSDVALLDSAAGFFGHMEFVTASELSYPFARDIAVLARQTVTKALQVNAPIAVTDGEGTGLADMDIAIEDIFYNDGSFNLDDWSIFSTVFMDEVPPSRGDVGFDMRP